MPPKITIYTDGAASGNPGPGGFGAILKSGGHYKELSGGYRLTTNNRMELLAVIIALEELKIPGSEVEIYTDSRYVCDSIEKKWVFGWEKTGFKKKKNIDLWKRFLAIYPKHLIRIHWIKGHSSIPENEICDQLAVKASQSASLKIDYGYEKNNDDESIA
jgi:ribonuclease HI